VNINVKIGAYFCISVLVTACSSLENAPGYKLPEVHEFERNTTLYDDKKEEQNQEESQYSEQEDVAITKIDAKTQLASQATTITQPVNDVELVLGKQPSYKNPQAKPVMTKAQGKDKGVALSFERASIREVVKVILGDILKVNYTVEPGVDGEVTINTSKPIAKESLLATLESLLQVHGSVLYKDPQGTYRIAPRSSMRGRGFVPETGKKLPAGYGIKIIPLRFIPAAEMRKILEPLANPDAFVRVDTNRNLLVLAGTSAELHNLLQTINTFDVDVLQGMSVGLYQIHNVDASIVAKNLDALFGESGNSPMAGMIKIMPIEHLNSLMIISASPDYLKSMKDWVDRFDRVKASEGQQLYVYHVQNGDAKYLADMLSQIFMGKKSKAKMQAVANVAPNLQKATLSSETEGTVAEPEILSTPKTMLGSEAEGLSITRNKDTRIVADETNNSLLIMATQSIYQQITQALKRIDIPPMQVLVEASIVEVKLSKNLEYGLQWYFKNGLGGRGHQGNGGLDADNIAGIAANIAGFSYSISNASKQVVGMLNLLAKNSQLKVISSPSILVLDNQEAEIRVGDQQPIFAGSTTTSGGVRTDSIQYKDTGVSLKVTPRVNSSGMITMSLTQEVTDVGEVDQATGQRSFLQRNIKSKVAVRTGETIVLGGLIRDNSTTGKQGLPRLQKLPIIGNLFGATNKQSSRTELLVLITPTAIKNQKDLYKTGQELRSKMKKLLESNQFL
jgi:general secretion pathway protein D